MLNHSGLCSSYCLSTAGGKKQLKSLESEMWRRWWEQEGCESVSEPPWPNNKSSSYDFEGRLDPGRETRQAWSVNHGALARRLACLSDVEFAPWAPPDKDKNLTVAQPKQLRGWDTKRTWWRHLCYWRTILCRRCSVRFLFQDNFGESGLLTIVLVVSFNNSSRMASRCKEIHEVAASPFENAFVMWALPYALWLRVQTDIGTTAHTWFITD